MAYKGQIGTSMGFIINIMKTKVTDPNKIHCDNCEIFVKGICLKLNEQTAGKIKWLTDKNDAKKCTYFTKKPVKISQSQLSSHKKNINKYRSKKRIINTN